MADINDWLNHVLVAKQVSICAQPSLPEKKRFLVSRIRINHSEARRTHRSKREHRTSALFKYKRSKKPEKVRKSFKDYSEGPRSTSEYKKYEVQGLLFRSTSEYFKVQVI